MANKSGGRVTLTSNGMFSSLKMLKCVLFLISIFLLNVSESADSPAAESPYTTRLKNSIKPLKYTVKVRPVLEDSDLFQQWTNNGEVLMSFTVTADTDTFSLHAYNLTVLQSDVMLKDSKSMEVKIKSMDQNEKRQTFNVMTESPLKAGENYNVFLPFIGMMMGKDVGLYAFTYPDAGGNNAKMAAATQSQPFHTREIFPCFDEPDKKAIFSITIGRLEKYQTFSNTKVKEMIPDPTDKGWVWDVYEDTPLMSTNLVSVIVVDDYTSAIPDLSLSPNVKIQVWAPKIITEQRSTDYAATLTAKFLTYFQEYFDYPYPLDKLDSVVIYESEGPAVEHWGSITYGLGGGSLLQYPGRTPEWKRFNTITLIAHEIVHSWMGNLISCEWFTDVWIHEGFADFLADEAATKLNPEFHADVLFINSHFQRALRADQSYKSHPVKHMFRMSKVMAGEEEETDAFDEIAYSKGASLVKMMKNFLTEPVFKDGVRKFLKKFAYKSISQDDLFESLNSAQPNKLPEGVTVKKIMDTWTLQPGYPIVRVNVEGPNSVQLIQEKFKIGMDNEDTSDPRWFIPIKMVSAAKPKLPENSLPHFWIPETTKMMSYSTDIDTTKWLILNPDATGFFRVMYDKNLKKLIKDQLNKDHTVFSAVTRSQIIDDHFNLAAFNYIPLEEALELTTYLHKEMDLVVWNVIFTHLKTSINMFADNGDFTGLQKYLLPKIDAVLQSPGVTVDQDAEGKGSVVLFRAELLRYGCMLSSKVCHKYVTELMGTWMALEDTNPIPVDLQPTLYCAGVKAGDKKTWDFVKRMHDRMLPSEQKMLLFKALGCSSEPGILAMFLDQGWQTNAPMMYLETMAESPQGQFLVFESIKSNLNKLKPEEFIRILNILSEYWIDPEQINDLEKFAQTNSKYFEDYTDELIEEIESHKANSAWMNAVGKQMDDWFIANS